jgi:AAA domain-containing protein
MAGFGTHRTAVIKALLDALQSDDVAVVAAMLGSQLDDIAAPNATRPRQITELVLYAEQRGAELELLRSAQELNDGNAELDAVVRIAARHLEALRPWYQPPDPLETCIVGSDQAFIDRVELRQQIQRLLPQGGWRALVVHGDPHSGRSFSLELISYVVGDAGDARVVVVDLKDSAPDLGPEDLVRRIALQMTLELAGIPPQTAQAPKWNEELRDWLIGRIEGSGLTCWLVIDAIDTVRPSDATMDLIWKLAAAARNRPRLRVVLLACSERPPDPVRALEEKIKPIDRDMIEAFFTQFYEHKGLQAGDELVRKATDQALARVPAGGDDRLHRLQDEVAKVARTIAEGTL